MKIVQKSIDELTGDEILGRAILSLDYQIILPEGAILKKEYIERLRELDITDIFVSIGENNTQEIQILKSEIIDNVTEKIKTILEHHTYQHNEELIELSHTADSIITNIVNEEEVIEQVYDIKQRSADLYEHSLSLSTLAVITALKLKVPQDKIHDIGVACLLHDIGLRYLTIPYDNQNLSELSEADVLEFKKHPIYGYSSLRNEEWITDISKNIILYHHERLDGSGYPLHTARVPQEAMIVAVCDTFDEMICGIGCKKVKVYEAVEYLKNFKKIKFDENIVNIFLGLTAVYPAGTKVITTQGDTAVVVRQNREFPDRPVLRIIADHTGRKPDKEKLLDLVQVHNVFIDKVLE